MYLNSNIVTLKRTESKSEASPLVYNELMFPLFTSIPLFVVWPKEKSWLFPTPVPTMAPFYYSQIALIQQCSVAATSFLFMVLHNGSHGSHSCLWHSRALHVCVIRFFRLLLKRNILIQRRFL